MTTPSFKLPTIEDISEKIQDALKPLVDFIEEAVYMEEDGNETPAEAEYSDTHTDLITSLKGQEKRIIDSDLGSDEKIYALNSLYSTWAGFIK